MRNEKIHLFWKQRSKYSKRLGESTKKDLWLIQFYHYPRMFEEDRPEKFSVQTKKGWYEVFKSRITPLEFEQSYWMNEKMEFRDFKWDLMSIDEVDRYCIKEGFEGWRDIDKLYEFVIGYRDSLQEFYCVVEWNYPLTKKVQRSQAKLVI